MKLVPIIVLSDGETWSLAEGASLLMVTESQAAALQDGARVQDIRPAAEMSLDVWERETDSAPRPEGGAS